MHSEVEETSRTLCPGSLRLFALFIMYRDLGKENVPEQFALLNIVLVDFSAIFNKGISY